MSPKRKSTIRKMRGYPVSRKLHHLIAELQMLERRFERVADEVEQTEMDARAERAREKRGRA